MRVALCQLGTHPDDVVSNTETVLRTLKEKADLYVFPEMFLTGYTAERDHPDEVRGSVERILSAVKGTGKCAIVGGPEYADGRKYNSAYVISDSVETYRKINLPNFPPFREKEMYDSGNKPYIFDFKGTRIGVCVCYDIFFPEVLKTCSMNGSRINVCISASPTTSRKAFECVVSARAIENTSYLFFVNNIGTYGNTTFFGGSGAWAPDGQEMSRFDDEGIYFIDTDDSAIDTARRNRPVLADTVSSVAWPER